MRPFDNRFKQACVTAVLFFVTLTFVASTCDDDDSDSTNPNTEVQAALQSGNWRVNYFFDDSDETYHFLNYTFTFKNNGAVLAVSPANTVEGTWSTRRSSNGSSKLILNFAAGEPFEELNDDWDITETSNTLIKLSDVSGGNGEIDYLTLEKQ